MSYFSLDWTADRTGLSKAQIEELSHLFGSTKPAALVWGMQSPGHHYNGYCASIIGVALNVITGNFDVPGGVIDTELVKSDKGGSATGKQFKSKKIKRMIDGKEVEGEVEHLHMDLFGSKYPAAWDDAVADYPNAFMEGVDVRYGPVQRTSLSYQGIYPENGQFNTYRFCPMEVDGGSYSKGCFRELQG